MRLKACPEDFQVEELIELPKGPARFAYYRVEKVGIPTPLAQLFLAHALGVKPRDVFFPALKDSRAVAIQYASVPLRGDPPREIHRGSLRARLVGRGPRRLGGGDLLGNRFRILVRGLSPDDAEALRDGLLRVATLGFPNYFDEQRFGSLSPLGSPGKAILRRDAAGALRFYLAEELRGDPEDVLVFKRLAREHWGEWGFLLERAPRPSNFRSLLAFLKDHPRDYRKALNLIPPRLLSLFLSAYQSLLWNRILGRWIALNFPAVVNLKIAGENLPVPTSVSDGILPRLRREKLALPHNRARYRSEWEGIAQEILTEEGMNFQDLKARIVERAYLSKTERPIWCFPGKLELGEPREDELHSGQKALEVRFTLPSGSYGTLYIKTSWTLVHERKTS